MSNLKLQPEGIPKKPTYAAITSTVPIDNQGNTLIDASISNELQPIDMVTVKAPRRKLNPRPALSETMTEAVETKLNKHIEEKKMNHRNLKRR